MSLRDIIDRQTLIFKEIQRDSLSASVAKCSRSVATQSATSKRFNDVHLKPKTPSVATVAAPKDFQNVQAHINEAPDPIVVDALEYLKPCRIKLVELLIQELDKAPDYRKQLLDGYKEQFQQPLVNGIPMIDQYNIREQRALFWLRRAVYETELYPA